MKSIKNQHFQFYLKIANFLVKFIILELILSILERQLQNVLKLDLIGIRTWLTRHFKTQILDFAKNVM